MAAFGAMMVHTPIAEASSEVTDFGSIEGMPVSEDSLSSELLLRGTRTAFMSGGGRRLSDCRGVGRQEWPTSSDA